MEIKWIEFLQSHVPLGFNDNMYHVGDILNCPILIFFLSFEM